MTNEDGYRVAFSPNQFANFPPGSPLDLDDEEEESTSQICGKLNEMEFCTSSFIKRVMAMMRIMRSHHLLTDVILEVDSELFHAHKVVLAGASPYFKAMFTGGLKECEMTRVKLLGVCPTAMAKLLHFMYTGQIKVTEVIVCSLLPAATMLQIPNVVEACCTFLENQLDPTNAIGIANFAEQHCCNNLHKKANEFIEKHFSQICQEEEFLQLSAIQLVCLVRKDELNVEEKGEREVFNAVMKWVRYNEEARGPKMEPILRAVRCQLLPPTFLKDQMKNCDVLRKRPECRQHLAQVFRELTLHKTFDEKERKPNTPRVIFVAGGIFGSNSINLVESYNVDEKTWTRHSNLYVPRSGLGGACVLGRFFVVGGRKCFKLPDRSECCDDTWVDRYNPAKDHWRPCSSLTVPRSRVGVAVMDGLLFAVGGCNKTEVHNTVEYYDPEDNRWRMIQPMHTKRFAVGVAVINRLLYAIGGYDGKNKLNSVECYHPEKDEWNMVAPMNECRSTAGVASIGQYIFVVGGTDGKSPLSSVERYDTERDVWEYVSPMPTARSALSVTVLDGKLYAMGGLGNVAGQTSYLATVEIYDSATDKWEQGVPMTSPRSGHASAMMYQFCPIPCDHLDNVDLDVNLDK